MSGFFDFQEQVARRRAAARKPAIAAGKPPAAEAAPAAGEALSVAQLTQWIEGALKAHLPATVLVKGEVSNFRNHTGSGHLYFTLKDAAACIDCVMFRSDAARLSFMPADGLEMLAAGRVAVFAQRGRYQLYVSRLQPLGQGALELAFQQLRAKLEAQGLFAEQRKKPLPLYPMRLALVTSLHTAALQDMLKVLRRYPWVRLYIYHVPVQGDGSAEQIAAAIEHLNRCGSSVGGIDLILLGRGGGSLEDLWEFNQEIVARAICGSGIPIISGIGHEVDVSIADLAADYHAHTPTEAAQVAMARWKAVKDAVDLSGVRLRRGLRAVVQECRHRLLAIERHEAFRRPVHRINMLRQLLDDRQRSLSLRMGDRLRMLHRRVHEIAERLDRHRPAAVMARLREHLGEQQTRLARAMGQRLHAAHDRLGRLTALLHERHPRHLVSLNHQRLEALSSRLRRAAAYDQQRRRQQLERLAAHLNAVGPEQVLKRGYTITMMKKTGQVVRRAGQVKEGDRLVTRLADGRVESIAQDRKQLPLFE